MVKLTLSFPKAKYILQQMTSAESTLLFNVHNMRSLFFFIFLLRCSFKRLKLRGTLYQLNSYGL